jgi:hypothetical protein
MKKFRPALAALTNLIYLGICLVGTIAPSPAFGARAGRVPLNGHLPPERVRLAPVGRLPADTNLSLALGLPLRNKAALEQLLGQLYDPQSTNFHRFLTPQQFTANFGPVEQDYQAVIDFAVANGLTVAATHSNRVVLDVEGSVADIERAFGVVLRTYRHPTEQRDFFAADAQPTIASNLLVVDVEGLTDFQCPRPLSHATALPVRPLSGSGGGGYYAGNDFRNAYAPGVTFTGTGQSVGLLEFSDYFQVDVTNYENSIGAAHYVPLNNVVIGHPGPTTANNFEVALDIEVAIAMAPGLSQVIVYEEKSINPSSLLSRMANDNLAKQLSSSWSWGGGPSTTVDGIFQQMASQGQSFFQASGDSDAYTGLNALDNVNLADAPVDNPYLTAVGGVTLNMNGVGSSWASETVWNYNIYGGQYANEGSSGGISTFYSIPSWQTNVNMTANQGSTTKRCTPDVALTGDGVYVAYNNGSSGGAAGTSCAAPLWAGLTALINQQSVASSGSTVGFLNPALYAIANGPNYLACFHDTTSGDNIGTNTPGFFPATSGYDLCTGLGTPTGTNLINALAPYPILLTQPASQTATNGNNVTLSVAVGGQSPFTYHWLFNGAILAAGGNISGVAGNVMTLAPVALTNAGNYSVVASNTYGAVTSSVATLTVVFPPAITSPPANQTVVAGNNALFSVTASGASPLAFQWRKNGANLANGPGISGATTNALSLSGVTAASAGNYTVLVTNIYGAVTSSVATLTIALPAAITTPLTNQTVECGSNSAFAVAASGTSPLSYHWSLDGAPLNGATNASLSLTNIHLPGHTIAVVVTNLYGSATSSMTLTVTDTAPPAISLHGSNPIYVEFGGTFTDPGASATDACAGALAAVTSGSVNTNSVGTNTLFYTANDGNGNIATANRTVIVRDTTPPVIVSSFTNLLLAANASCAAQMPDVTGTNFIVASDLSLPLAISQSPTNGATLLLETNVVVISVLDASSNAAYSTNIIIVADETPPVMVTQPQSQTIMAGTTANFTAAATACTPLVYQWFFNQALLTNQTGTALSLASVNSGSAGNYSVVATAAGGSTTSIVATLTVQLRSPALALISTMNPSGFQSALTFSASLSPTNATGSVQFLTNGVPWDSESLVNGMALSTNLATLPRGTNVITASYSGDSYDLAATNTLLQIVTNHPPRAAPAFYTRLAGSSLTISVADLATNWTDLDGDAISLANVGTSTNGVSLTNQGGILSYVAPNDLPDQFVCTITDGWSGTNFQTVNIAVMPAGTNTTPQIFSLAVNPDGSVALKLGGAPGHSYILETRTNFTLPGDWQPIATNLLGTNGVWQFSDPQATNLQQRYFRLKLDQ